jgi:uroporphyrin-III C-methyltransferase
MDQLDGNGFGCVTIAGAGPGEIEHLTVGVLRAIKSADVILYDALLRPSILAEFPNTAKCIFVGKRCGDHAYTQTMIISAMIEAAIAGRNVLRLKGGDPAIFAHLASEVAALEALSIPLKILPGVSAMNAAAAELRAPLTSRGSNRHVWITDGHAAELELQRSAMAVYPGTLVFYMAAGNSTNITKMLHDYGMPAEKLCALVENAGSADAVVTRGKLREFATGQRLRVTNGPGILLIGDTIGLATEPKVREFRRNHASTV